MAKLPENPTPLDVEFHFRSLLAREGLRQPDQIRYEPERSQLVFVWHKPELAIEIELGPEGPVDLRESRVEGLAA